MNKQLCNQFLVKFNRISIHNLDNHKAINLTVAIQVNGINEVNFKNDS